MIKKFAEPTIIEAAGSKPKHIEEFIVRMNSETKDLSIARMRSPSGWVEPGQTPEFDEYTLVLKGLLRVESQAETLDISTGQAVFVQAGTWVRYSTPSNLGAEYIAVCRPAFSPETIHRDPE